MAKVYGNKRNIVWVKAYAGDAAVAQFGTPLPAETLEMLDYYGIGMKGPLGTPTGGGIRSLNVTMRQHFDWFSCVRPVRYFKGIVSVVKRPQDLDVVIFRENTEDVYAGVEYEMGSPGALEHIEVAKKHGHNIREDSGICIRHLALRLSAHRARSPPVRHRPRPQGGDDRAQGQHPEVHRRRVPEVGSGDRG